jgi:hypothetical protein
MRKYITALVLSLFLAGFAMGNHFALTGSKASGIGGGGPQFLIGLGPSTFLGELGGKATLGSDDFSDIDFPTLRYAISGGLRIPLGRTFALRGLLTYARLSGSDENTINPERNGRNLNFVSPLTEGSLALEFSLGQSKRLYAYGGVGMAFFNPYTELNGTKYYLQPLGTEGQNFDQNNPPYALSATVYPFGFGYRVPAGRGMFSFELAMRKSTTDYIDDVSTTFADPAQIRANAPAGQGQVAVDLADRSTSTIPGFSDPGAIRGDPTDNDNYFFLMVYYHIPLGAKGNNGSFGGGGKKGRGRMFGGKRKCVEF